MDLLKRHRRAASAASEYTPEATEASLGDSRVEKLRRRIWGGQLTPTATTQLRWMPADVEDAMASADLGDISKAAQLWSACQHDATVRGVLASRTQGLVRLPKTFSGAEDQLSLLAPRADGHRSLFDELCPSPELALMAADGDGLGVAVGELVPVQGRQYPVLVRLEPEFLRYYPTRGRWYYRSTIGNLPIDPGDGRWVLHLPGGRVNPWRSGLWASVGESYIHASHARAYSNNWQAKLANPARVAMSPAGATDQDDQGWFQRVMAWGVNTVFAAKPGYEVKLIESNGRGWESFEKTIAREERAIMIAIAGQDVTTTGGSGFQNSEVQLGVKQDIIQASADALAHTVNTQILPPWVMSTFGADALARSAAVAWDVTPPGDRTGEAAAQTAVLATIKLADEILAARGLQADAETLLRHYQIPIQARPKGAPRLELVKSEDAA